MDSGANPQDSAEALLLSIKKGANAGAGRDYVGDYIWAKLWRAVTAIANCPPDLNSLLMYRAEISACMKIAQDIQLELATAEMATKRIRDLFSKTPRQLSGVE